MYEVSINTSFSAAHHLAGYRGTCEAVHGHNWDVTVYVAGEELDSIGLLVDFRHVRREAESVLEMVDHADLNALDIFQTCNPSSENLARYLFDELSGRLNSDRVRVSRVTVCETPGSAASYWKGGSS